MQQTKFSTFCKSHFGHRSNTFSLSPSLSLSLLCLQRTYKLGRTARWSPLKAESTGSKCSHVGERAGRVSIYSAVFGNRSDYEIIKPRIQAGRRAGTCVGFITERACMPLDRRTLEIYAIHHARKKGRLPNAYFRWKWAWIIGKRDEDAFLLSYNNHATFR